MLSANPQLDDHCYRLAMQSTAAGMAIIDLQGRWVDVNPVLVRLLGHENAQTLNGRAVSESFHPDVAVAAHEYLVSLGDATSTKDASAQALPRRYQDRHGKLFQARAEVSVMHDGRGPPRYLVMHLYDPSPDAGAPDAEQALAEAELALQVLTRQQEVLAHGISHDLRAPLRAIESFSSLLQRHSGDALDDTGRDHLQRIRAAAARMGGLIEALLDLARVDRNALDPEIIDISLLADWVAADLQDAHPERTAEITIAPDLQAYGNERLIRMLLQQLLDNAWRFSCDHDVVRISVDGEVADGKLQVNVRDQGSGFDMRYADKIMEPFQRLHAPEQGGGYGIGLAIAKRIVERHGGWLHAQSQDDLGSVFTFALPASEADAAMQQQVKHEQDA